jgi:hypothetical protein
MSCSAATELLYLFVCIYIYTQIQVYFYTYIHAYIHTYTHTGAMSSAGFGTSLQDISAKYRSVPPYSAFHQCWIPHPVNQQLISFAKKILGNNIPSLEQLCEACDVLDAFFIAGSESVC